MSHGLDNPQKDERRIAGRRRPAPRLERQQPRADARDQLYGTLLYGMLYAMKALKKKPVQLYLDPKQDRLLGQLARSMERSKAEVIRMCIDRFLTDLPLEKDPAMEIVALGRSGRGDLARRHDAYLVSHEKPKKR